MHTPRKVSFAIPKNGRAGYRTALVTGLVTALLLSIGHTAEAVTPLSSSPTPSPAAKPQPVTERPDRASAALTARLQGSRVLVTSETTETSLTYVNHDGTTTVETSGEPVRTRQAGRWVSIDTSLIEQDGAIKPKAVTAQMALEFSAGGEGPFAKLTRPDGKFFALSWPSPLPTPRIEGNKVIYADVAGTSGADLVVTALATGFRHDVVLRERPTGPVEFTLPIQAQGLAFGKGEHGDLTVSDAKGKPIASAPEPVMYATSAAQQTRQTAGPSTARTAIGKIDTEVVTKGDRQVVVLRPDADFLADPSTIFPVTVDPTIELTSTAKRTILGPYSSTGYLSDIQVSTFDNPANNEREFTRALLKFDTSTLVGKTVTDAKLQLTSSNSYGCVAGQNIKAQRITATWTPSSTYWANQPATTTAGEQLAQQPGQCTGTPPEGTWTWPITDIAAAWAGGAAGHGVMLRLATEHPVLYEQQYERAFTAPTLIITYGSTPAVETLRAAPVATSGDGIVYTNTTTPTLHAFTKDPDSGLLRAEFEVEHDPAATGQGTGQVWTGAVDNVSAGAEAKLAVAAGTLTDGSRYRWRARAFDGTDYSAWSAWQLLAVDATAPQSPTIDCPIQEGGWAFVGSDDYVCSLSGIGDVKGFWWGLDDPSTPSPAELTVGNVNYPLNLGEIEQGWHTLYAKSRDKAHNTSTVATYRFGVTPGGIITPADGTRTIRSAPLTAMAPPSRTAVRYEMTNLGVEDFKPIPPSDVTVPGSGTPITGWPQIRSETAQSFPALTWDVAKSLREAPTSLAGVVEIRACFSGGSTAEECTKPIKVTLDQSAFGSSYATAEVGPGRVALQTGDYSIEATDAALFGIAVSRTHASLNPGADREDEMLAENKVFGPGWRGGFPSAPSAIADFSPTSAGESGSLQVVGADGSTLSYIKNGDDFSGVGDAADGSRITTTAEQLTHTNAVGGKTTYTKVGGKWVVTRTETAEEESAVTYHRDAQGRITRVLAPAPTGVTCGPTLAPGCRALELSYATTTTATGIASNWGDYASQAKSVSFTAFDPESNAMKTTVLASYLYDSTGRLRQVTDPRTNLATVYYYTGEGRVSQMNPPGLAPWRIEYDSRGRLAHVQREAGDADPTQAVAYGIPIGGTNAPIDLTLTQTSKWGQSVDLPVVGAAIFRPSHVPGRDQNGAYTPTATDWEYGALVYTDVNGRAVNTANYGAGSWQISATRYDDNGRSIWELTAGNRTQALTPTSDTDPYVAGRRDSSERAHLLSRTRTYGNNDKLVEGLDPARQVLLDSGALVSSRQRTLIAYDEGKPDNSTTYRLPTTSKIEPLVLDGSATPGPNDVRTTKMGYDAVVSGDVNGWVLRRPTNETIVLYGQPDIVRQLRFDAAGREIERRMPASDGADAGTTTITYYTAGANPSLAECGNKPHWAGFPCRKAPAAQPAQNPLPATLTTYGYLGEVVTVRESVGSITRTTTTLRDTAGRVKSSTIEVTPEAEGGSALPEITYTYDPATGLKTQIESGGAVVSIGYDSFGREARMTDADGNTSITTYTLDYQVATVNDGKGVTTYTYDGISADGKAERRGIPVKIEASGIGTFTAAYDADGQLVQQTYPNGLAASYRYDGRGTKVGQTYSKNGTPWMEFAVTPDVLGRVAVSHSSEGSQQYTYDTAGRLTQVADTYRGQCTTRVYGFDANSNRTSFTAFGADTAGECSTSTSSASQLSSFDEADRISDNGYSYDKFGRTTQVPAVHVEGGSNLQVGYHVNDMVASLQQDGQSKTFTLDPLWRVRSMTSTGGSRPGTMVNHYSDSSDSPAWIAEADGTWTRNIGGFNGLAAIQSSTGSSTIQLINLHGDVVATSDNTAAATGVNAYFEQTEYGTPRDENSTNPSRYGWLGGEQRSVDSLGGLVLMGVRLYNPATGRFLQVDPIIGGSANNYGYCSADPINCYDLDGTRECNFFSICNAIFWGIEEALGLACRGTGFGYLACKGLVGGLVALIKHAYKRSDDPKGLGTTAEVMGVFWQGFWEAVGTEIGIATIGPAVLRKAAEFMSNKHVVQLLGPVAGALGRLLSTAADWLAKQSNLNGKGKKK